MRTSMKFAAGLALAGALALGATTPSQARWHHGWHNGGAAVAGFAAGALVGAAASNAYYGPGYYGNYGYYGAGNAYAYDPGYAADNGYMADYGYAPTPYYGGVTSSERHCGVSPASMQAGICSP